MPTSPDDAPRLAEMQYEDLRALGVGAGSEIRLIRDAKTGRRYALKVVDREGPDDDIYIEQAKHEYEVARMLRHPCLLTIHDCRIRKSWFRIAGVDLLMEYVEGKTLDGVKRVAAPSLVGVFRRVAGALRHMHRRGVIHGDLKPGNIIASDAGQVVVIDFGTAWIKGEPKDRIQGTPEYMAPEQERRGGVDERTDVYNLGATIYKLATGQHANLGIVGMNNAKLAGAMRKPPAAIVSSIPKSLSDLIMACIEPQPKDRPPSAADLIERLEPIAVELGLKADEEG